MAFENPLGTNFLAIFPMSTGLRQYQGVRVSSTVAGATDGCLANPTTLGEIIGVLVSSGTTSSTVAGRLGSVQVYGVAKMLQGTTAGPVVGARASVDANGLAIAGSTADAQIGYFMSNSYSTGIAGTTDDEFGIVSVLLLHLGKASTIA